MRFLKYRAFFILLFLAVAVLAVAQVSAYQFWAGVTKGQYVKYGNFAGTGVGMQAYNDNEWMKYEVVDVNETLVTLVLTGQFKNGTEYAGNGNRWVYNLTLLNSVNGTWAGQNPLIPADMEKHELLTEYSLVDYINDTVTRTYLGESRTVNILNYSVSTATGTITYTYFYDKASGMLLEMQGQSEDLAPQGTRAFSYVVVDTNIFGPNKPLPIEYVYIIVAAAGVGLAVAGTVTFKVLRSRKKSHKTRH